MSKNRRTQNPHNPRNSDSAQRFADILRQTADMHRDDPRDSIMRLLAIARHKESVTGGEDTVTLPRDEYNNLVAAKATLGLLISLEEGHTLTDYDIGKILRMMSGVTADA